MQALTTIDNKSIRKVTLLFLLKNIQEVQQKNYEANSLCKIE